MHGDAAADDRGLLGIPGLLPLMLANLNDGVMLADARGRVTYCNPAAERLLGTNLTDSPLADLPRRCALYLASSGTLLDADALPLSRAVRGEEGAAIEVFVNNVEMRRGIFLSLRGTQPVCDAEGVLHGGLLILRDLTDSYFLEQRLMHNQVFVQALMDHVPNTTIFFKDEDSRYLRVNRALADQFGLTDPLEVVGRGDRHFFGDDYAQRTRAEEEEVLRTGLPRLNQEQRERQADGRERWVSTSRLPLRDVEGRVIGTFGLTQDVTERVAAMDAPRASEASFRNLFASSPDAVFVEDRNGIVLDVNPAACKLHGRTAKEFIGQNILDLIPAAFRPRRNPVPRNGRRPARQAASL